MLLLILITIAPLAARLRSDSGGLGEENVISIEANEKDISAAGQSNTPFQVEDTKDGESRVWSAEEVNEIDLFSESDINIDGETTVKSSENGTNLVAPGTSGKYNFSVKNTGSLPLTYYITVKKGTFSADKTELPIKLKLAGEDQKVVDDSTGSDWGTAEYNSEEGLDNYEIKSGEFELAGNSSDEYTLDWNWLYENGSDQTDTDFGNYLIDPGYNPEYKLTITVHAEYDLPSDSGGGGTIQTPDTEDTENTENVDKITNPNTEEDSEIGDDENDKVNSGNNNDQTTLVDKLRDLLPKTGDAANVMLWILIMLLCAAGAVVLVRAGTKKRADKK
jgi:hypothetical protein